MHRGGADNDQRVVGDFLLLLGGAGRGSGPDEQTARDEQRRPEQGLVQRGDERRRDYVLDPPMKRLEHVSKKNESIPTGALG